MAIVSPFEVHIMDWTVIAVLARLDWLDKVHQLTPRKPAQTLAIISPFERLMVVAVLAGVVGWTKCIK